MLTATTPSHRRIGWIAAVTVLALVATACGNRRPRTEDAMVSAGAGSPVAGVASGDAPLDGGGLAPSLGGSSTEGVSLPGGEPTGGGPTGPTGLTGAGATAAAGGATADIPTAAGGPAADSGEPTAYDDGASDKEVVFGSVSGVTGLISDFMLPQGARAYFKHVNARGGVNGRTLRLLIYDDGWDATRNAALTRQALDSDKVFAFVFNGAPLSSHGGMAYIDQKKVPVIGGDMINLRNWGHSPHYYPQSYLESVTGGRLGGRWAGDIGCKRVAGLAGAADESRSWVDSFEVGLKDRGQDGYVYESEFGLAESDFTPYVVGAKNANADCITIGGFAPFFVRFRRAMAQQNYKAKLVLPSSAYDPVYRDEGAPLNEGDFMIVQYDILENAAQNPAVKEFVDAATRFEPGMRQTGYALLAWTSAKIAVEALSKMGNNLTRQNLLDTLNRFTDYDTGITPKLTYRPGPHPGATCGNVVQVTGKAFRMARPNYCL